MEFMAHSLTLENVYKKYFQAGVPLTVLNGVNALFEQGTSYAITGASGSGKSTLIHLIAGLDNPSSGTVYFDQTPLTSFLASQKTIFLNKMIGLVFQYPYLIKELSVIENVAIKGLIAGKPMSECTQQAQDLLVQVGLSEKVNAYPGQLSGGQKQRVALARALMNEPSFLIADEPTGNLDQATGMAIVDLILKLQQEKGMGIIVSSHDDYVSSRMNIRYELKDGLLCQVER
ncbi:MAG: lipoprotein-releasing system ATP-binding protein LolD [Candidatus Babeliales bacterium]